MRPRPAFLALLLALAFGASGPGLAATGVVAASSSPASAEFPRMKIRMGVDGQVVTATLDDSAVTRDFAALLPLSLVLSDYAQIERIEE